MNKKLMVAMFASSSFFLSSSVHADVFDELNKLISGETVQEEKSVNVANENKEKDNSISDDIQKAELSNNNLEKVSSSDIEDGEVYSAEDKKEIPDFEVVDGKYIINNVDKYNKTFLRNVPSGSIFISNEDILVQAGREYVFFDDGEIKYESPIKQSGKVSFCYIKVPLNNSRIMFPKDDYRGLKISFSEPQKEILSDDTIVYSHRFWFGENDLFDSFTCRTTISDKPLSIDDINKETGDRFKIRFAPVVKAKLFN